MILIGVAILSSSGHSINTVELVSVLIRAHGNRIMNKIHMITGAVLWRRGSIISEALSKPALGPAVFFFIINVVLMLILWFYILRVGIIRISRLLWHFYSI